MNILFLLLCVTCFIICFWGIFLINSIYRFSFLFVVSFVGFIIPQVVGIINNDEKLITWGKLPENSLNLFMLNSIFCLLGTWFGDLLGSNCHVKKISGFNNYNLDKLIFSSAFFTLASIAIRNIGMSLLDEDYIKSIGNQWTGPITIIYFFMTIQKYGHGLSMLIYLYCRSSLTLLVVILNTLIGLISSFIISRRGNAIDLLFIVLLSLWFVNRIRIPVWLFFLICFVGSLWSNSIGYFRSAPDHLSFIQKLEQMELLKEFEETLSRGGHEVGNACMIIWSSNFEGEYDYGQIHWNQLVHAYFPGQLFGHELKKSLKFPIRDLPKELLGYKGPIGVTSTGMADAFASFWFFGCIKFGIIGFVMGRWYRMAMFGDLSSQLAYITLMGSALHTVSHGTSWFLNNFIHMAIFAYPMLYWAFEPAVQKLKKTSIPI